MTSDSNSYTEGASANRNTGVFFGPSNCACDYTVSNGWGDGTSSTPSLDNFAPGDFLLFGPHTYAEEGNYTTTMTATDNWGNAASANGSAAVADAPLTAAGTTSYGAKSVSLTKAVATFTDADPGGTASDYTATIHWGDGATSAGTVSGHFSVTGTHTYTSTGTKTISVTITDAGGASATATSTAHIGSLPALASVSPTSGTHLGGKTVTITGTNLSGATSVKFGTAGGTILTDTATKITVKTPAHATGTVDIRVTTKYGTSNITSHDKYTFT